MSVISLINKIPFGNPAEKGFFLYSKVPPSVLAKLQEKNFSQTIRYAYLKSPFYKKKWDELRIRVDRIRRPEDLGDFFTTAEDIRQNPKEFLCARPDTAYETTGTTSKKTKRVYFSRQEVKEAGWAGAVGLWGLGVREEDRIASAFDYSFWVSGPVLQASCEVLGCFHVEAGRIDPQEFYERLSDYGITVIVGDPSWLLRLAEIAEEKGSWPVKLILGGGENLTEAARHTMEKVWGADVILSYGQTEAFGAIGMESKEKAGYHLNEFHNAFEIINPDQENYGELVYTTLNRRVMPLIRYRSGDITRFIQTPSLSMPGRRIEKLKGRVDEWTVTAMGNIAPWMFESVFKNVAATGGDWQIVVDKEGNKDRVSFHLEVENGAGAGDLKEKVLQEFKKEFQEAWRISEMGLLHLGVEFHPKGSLRSGRKLQRIVDNRKFN